MMTTPAQTLSVRQVTISNAPSGGGPYRWGPPWRHGWRQHRGRHSPWLGALILATLVAIVQVGVTLVAASHQSGRTALDWLGVGLLLIGPAALVVRRRFPVAVLLVAVGSSLTYVGLDYPRGPIFLSVLIALFTAIVRGHRLATWLIAASGLAGHIAVLYAQNDRSLPVVPVIASIAWVLVVLLLAEAAREGRARAAAARKAYDEQLQRRTSEQRLHIARELHDVLAHNISLINVQASVALHLIDEKPDQVRSALEAIKKASKDTLREMRSALGVLRQVDETAPRTPAPGLAQLDELVARMRDAGLTVQPATTGMPLPLPAAVDLAAYRIVQEALTNVYRHSGSNHADVTIHYDAHQLTLRIEDQGPDGQGRTNQGHGAREQRSGPSSESPESQLEIAGAAGSGITGMTERAAAVGGELRAEPRPAGGWRVTAVLPTQ